jgi:predicted O-methyltransferase YrrM
MAMGLMAAATGVTCGFIANDSITAITGTYMIEQLRTGLWFLKRPSHWPHAVQLVRRKWLPNYDTPADESAAEAWAAARSVPLAKALVSLGVAAPGEPLPALPARLLDEAQAAVRRSAVRMGGPGDLNLLYAATTLLGAHRIVETGVAYGWSSLAILAALAGRAEAKLISVDMPYPKMNGEQFVGIAVPQRLRGPWDIIREPDRPGIVKAIARLGGTLDLCHYDSDKSWWGRQYSYPILWNALTSGGLFISDDVQDNMAFAEFAAARRVSYAVIEFDGKYVGLARKP